MAVADGDMVIVAVDVGRGVLVAVASGVLVGGIVVLVAVASGVLVGGMGVLVGGIGVLVAVARAVLVAVAVCAYATSVHKADATATKVLIERVRITVRSGLRQHSTLPAYALRYVRRVERTKSATPNSLGHEAPSIDPSPTFGFLTLSIESSSPNDLLRGPPPLRTIFEFPFTLFLATDPTSPFQKVGA